MKKWTPSKTARREFAAKMQDPEYAAAYYQRKEERAAKRRAKSAYDYTTAGGMYIATAEQYMFCMANENMFTMMEQQIARNQVVMSYTCGMKIHHDSIHIVNEIRRAASL